MSDRARSFFLVGAASFLAASLATPRSYAADPQPYGLSIQSSDDSSLDSALRDSSQLQTLQQRAPAGPFALISRAKDDVPRLETALRSFGYYDGHVTIRIDGRSLDDADLVETLQAYPAEETIAIDVAVQLGQQYHLGRVAITGDCPPEVAQKLAIVSGQPAVAADVLAARSQLLAALQEDGYALAAVESPVALLDDNEKSLDITFKVEAGRRLTIGVITIEGTRDVSDAFVRRRLSVHTGQLYQPSQIEAARMDLASLGVFSGVAVRTVPQADANGQIPLVFDVQERPKHVVGLTAAYSTDLGGTPKVTWSDRNLFGEAEQLNLGAAATGLGGGATRGLGYNFTGQFIKPDFLVRDQSLQFDAGVLKQNLQAYDQDAITAGASLHRKVTDEWTAGIGLSTEIEKILQEGVTRQYEMVGVPLTAAFDDTGTTNPLLDPTHGMRTTLSFTPFESFGHTDATFVTLQASGSVYIDLARFGISRDGRSVLALRGLAGSVQGATQFQLPPDQRFYGGGSGTVRGFRYQTVGPLFADGKPIGGTSIDAGTIELRQRLFDDFGLAAFIDAGQVGDTSVPFRGAMRVGAGGGPRYYTSIGTVRMDVAVPVKRPPGGDGFELYIGLGQSF
ncbi:BamA/TamA family outer membrane protein [Telmatospirillum sp.]|uniref:autotransporter assembly complex protein TamA n=1 Tax=Telmatospirillum sp. TaxID=2079197 RepID=UPI002847B92F|nr:BamA/TamA family outer membrane protein [Telmatospirillum sp.]MDR3435372.1 BamA/TamA family outer membrane protein [Telmatospirillum sp.]